MGLVDTRVGKYFDAWESVDQSQREKTIRRKLREYVDHARQLEFYRRLLLNYDDKSGYPLEGVPVLEPKACREQLPPFGDGIIIGQPAGCNVFQSGGTTGVPKTTLFTHEELEGLNLPNARGFFAVGLEKTDRVAGLWASGSLYMTFIHINRMLQQYGCMNFPFSNHSDPRFVHAVTKSFGINCLTGVASSVLELVRAFTEYGLDGIKIDKVYYGAEHFYEADKREIQQKVGAEIILAPGYGTVDTWYLGYQCRECPTGVFHAHDDQVYLEIVDENQGRYAPPGEAGMLYVTAYCRRLTPIVRYRVGDRAKWMGEPCSCGRTTPLFRLLGRGDDVLRIGYDSVDYASLQQAVDRVGTLTGSVQMEKEREVGKDRLVVRVETDLSPGCHADLAKRLEAEFLLLRPALSALIEKGSVWPLRIVFSLPGSLTRNPKTGKLIRVVDVAGD